MASTATVWDKISPILANTFKQLQANQTATVIVIFDEQFTQAQEARLAEPAISRNEKLELFRASSRKAQEASLEFLTKKGKDYFTSVKNVDFDSSKVKQLKALNAMVLPATSKLVEELAEKPNILTILPNKKCDLISPIQTSPSELKK